MVILYVLLAILVLMFMIMIHESGHYFAGKILKFKINEFSIGFGPAIFTKTMKSGEIFSLRWIPLGGYCAFKGEDEDEEEGDTEGCFNTYPCWKLLIVLFSGAFLNFVSGIIFVFVLLLTVGSGVCRVTDVVATNGNQDAIFKNDIISFIALLYSSLLHFPIHGAIHCPKCAYKHGLSFPISRGKFLLPVLTLYIFLINSKVSLTAPALVYGPKYLALSLFIFLEKSTLGYSSFTVILIYG